MFLTFTMSLGRFLGGAGKYRLSFGRLMSNGAVAKGKLSPSLHDACKMCDLYTVTRLYKEGVDLNAVDSDKHSPISLACENGHLEIVNFLLDNGASIINSNPHYSLLHRACQEGHVDVAMELIRRGANIHVVDHFERQSALHVCASSESNFVEVAKELVKRGADIYRIDNDGNSPMKRFFSDDNSMEVAMEILNSGIDINQCDERGYTPLLAASSSENVSLVKELLHRGADVNLEPENKYLDTPLSAACTHSTLEVVKELLKAGANPNFKPVLLDAMRGRKIDVAIELIRHGADVNVKSEFDISALHRACKNDLGEVVEELIRRRADTNVESDDGTTPLHIASSLRIVRLLLDNGARVNVSRKNGYTPLHSACCRKDVSVVKVMLDHGADPNAGASICGVTPLQIASSNGYQDIVKELLDRGAKPEQCAKQVQDI